MTRPGGRPRLAGSVTGVLALALLALLASGCVRMPDEGPVVETRGGSGAGTGEGFNYDPLPPQPDATPAEIVQGFLDAMMAAPIQLNSARGFLSSAARADWRPERSTITYVTRGAPTGTTRVSVELPGGGDVFDGRGAWRHSLRGDQRALSFRMVVEDGQWRVDEAPDALIVSEQFFSQRFRRAALYFFDPTARILVPEPVFVPTGEQLATSLVKALLAGPHPSRRGVVRTFVPPGLDVGLSVPVSEGVATLSLAGSSRPTTATLRLMTAQLTWTLRQVPDIEELRITLGDAPVQLPEVGTQFPVTLGQEFDPSGQYASSTVFGLRDGALVFGSPDDLERVDGPFGAEGQALRSVGVDLDASSAAAVTGDGRAVLLGPVFGATGRIEEIVSRASDLLTPSWDFDRRLWLVDRGAGSATVLYREDSRLRGLRVPGITGQDVSSFLVSRDGSRFVAVVRRPGGDRLLVSRIVHDEDGRVRRALPARSLVLDRAGPRPIRDLAWADPTTVVALTRVAGQFWEVRSVSVDGAPPSLDSVAALSGRVRRLVGSPTAGQPLFVLSNDEALDVSGTLARGIPLDGNVTDLTYVG